MDTTLAPTPEALQATADQVRSAAGRLRDTLAPVAACCRDDVWTGARASRFAEAIEDERRRLDAVADQLEMIARRLELRATEAALAGPALMDPTIQRGASFLAAAVHP